MSTNQRVKVDQRIINLIENAHCSNFRNILVLVGDRAKMQVPNLYHIMTHGPTKKRTSVLWCYKKDLGFSSHAQKKMKKLTKNKEKGLYTGSDSPFDLFITSTEIKYCKYKDSHRILGNTFGLLILQDFEALTPNLLARTIETVSGGGLIIFLLQSLDSLTQLYSLTMDIHNRFRNENYQLIPRFNERFILSLGNCENSLVMDDSLRILPISKGSMTEDHNNLKKNEKIVLQNQKELIALKKELQGTDPPALGLIVSLAKTLHQAKGVMTFIEAISEKTLKSTVALTAARGRGKSAALGLAIAAALSFGYSNIFVTSPSPENLKTLFQFLFKGMDALSFQEHTDYEILESTNPELKGCIIRVNIFKTHRQTIQYIHPNDYQKLGQAELLCIDEAASIPLLNVKQLLGPYLVFMASTVTGYEGTGRSLSLKLIDQLKKQASNAKSSRSFREITLSEPIRYSLNDPVEKWLMDLLCLESSVILNEKPTRFPHPNQCELWYIDRDTLFSYHPASEKFLQKLVGLFVASHYKNSPDDLLLMSDCPTYHLFILTGPIDISQRTLPDILCAVQVDLEGQISKEAVMESLKKGHAPHGNLLPWNISQQFQDKDFPSLSGCRIVRIATNPNYQRMGYGSRVLELLSEYYQGDIINLDNEPTKKAEKKRKEETQLEKSNERENNNSSTLLSQEIKPKTKLAPLLLPLKERSPERLHYMGVSFGCTSELFSFWQKSGYTPLYLRQSPNDITGEHTVIMFKNLKCDDLEVTCDPNWLENYSKDFKRRIIGLLGSAFKNLPISLALTILNPPRDETEIQSSSKITKSEFDFFFSPYDLKRLETYSNNLSDHHLINDLVPSIARLFFTQTLPISLSASQMAILLALGLQMKSVDSICTELSIGSTYILAEFNKVIRKITQFFRGELVKNASESLPITYSKAESSSAPLPSLQKEFDEDHQKGKTGFYSISQDQQEKIDKELENSKKIPDILTIKRPANETNTKSKKFKKERRKSLN